MAHSNHTILPLDLIMNSRLPPASISVGLLNLTAQLAMKKIILSLTLAVAFVATAEPAKTLKVGDAAPAFKIKNTSDRTLFVKLQMSGIPLVGNTVNSERNLYMKVRYLDIKGNTMNPSQIEQGTDFIAEVEIKHPGLRQEYKEMALTQIFPSGWEIRNTRMDLVESQKMGDKPRYQDIRDDRVYSYFDLRAGDKKTYRVLLNAAYLGRFYLPTVYCEAMYDNEIYSRKAGRWVEVVEAGGSISARR